MIPLAVISVSTWPTVSVVSTAQRTMSPRMAGVIGGQARRGDVDVGDRVGAGDGRRARRRRQERGVHRGRRVGRAGIGRADRRVDRRARVLHRRLRVGHGRRVGQRSVGRGRRARVGRGRRVHRDRRPRVGPRRDDCGRRRSPTATRHQKAGDQRCALAKEKFHVRTICADVGCARPIGAGWLDFASGHRRSARSPRNFTQRPHICSSGPTLAWAAWGRCTQGPGRSFPLSHTTSRQSARPACSYHPVPMRLVIDDAIGKLEPEAVRTLKRIERDVSEELAGRLALVAMDPSAPIGPAVEHAVKFAGLLGKPERELARDEALDVLSSIIERDSRTGRADRGTCRGRRRRRRSCRSSRERARASSRTESSACRTRSTRRGRGRRSRRRCSTRGSSRSTATSWASFGWRTKTDANGHVLRERLERPRASRHLGRAVRAAHPLRRREPARPSVPVESRQGARARAAVGHAVGDVRQGGRGDVLLRVPKDVESGRTARSASASCRTGRAPAPRSSRRRATCRASRTPRSTS